MSWIAARAGFPHRAIGSPAKNFPIRGGLRELQGRLAEALACYRRAVELDPKDLRNVPGSVLWLAPPRDDLAMQNLRYETLQRGVEPARLVFAERQPRDAHLPRLALADIALDAYPYNSSTLFRPEAFARDLERLFAAMHAQKLAGRRESIMLAPANLPAPATETSG